MVESVAVVAAMVAVVVIPQVAMAVTAAQEVLMQRVSEEQAAMAEMARGALHTPGEQAALAALEHPVGRAVWGDSEMVVPEVEPEGQEGMPQASPSRVGTEEREGVQDQVQVAPEGQGGTVALMETQGQLDRVSKSSVIGRPSGVDSFWRLRLCYNLARFIWAYQ